MVLSCKTIKAVARDSPLSRVQEREVFLEIKKHFPLFSWEMEYLETKGDRDLISSLRKKEKSDFFTFELDEKLLAKQAQVAIHSAKDLPDPLPKGLALAALTKGVDPADSLVLREGESIDSLPLGSLIATSSQRREEMIRSIRSDFRFTEVRGKIHRRLEKLMQGEVDGVVMAEAAIIRLQLTELNRVRLAGETHPYQGKLAVVVREDDDEMFELFSRIDIRK